MGPTVLTNQERDTASRRARNTFKFNLIAFAVIFVAVTFFNPFQSEKITFAWEETQLKIICPDELEYVIPFASVTHICLVDAPDLGSCVSGGKSNTCCYGYWSNDTLGGYILCAYQSYSPVIQITTDTEDFWISYESAELTTSFFHSIVETLTEDGYSFEQAVPQK